MRLPPAIIPHTEELLREVLRFTGPADVTLSRYFREHPKLGSRERGVIAEAVYGLLRNKSVLTNFAESGSGPMMRRMALLGLADAVGELFPGERPVVDRRRQPETELHQVAFAGHVALVHAADLRHGHVGLVDDEEEVLREIVQQRRRRRACRPPVDVP